MQTAAQVWAAAELAGAELGDPRRTRRLTSLVAQVAEQPTASLPTAAGSWADTKAAYRLLDNAAIAPAAILNAARPAVLERIAAEQLVLVVQDSTSVDFSTHPQTTGLGHLEHPKRQGLMLHSALAVSPERVPLGLLAQQVWARPPTPARTRQQRRKRRYQDKESVRWEQTEAASLVGLPEFTAANRSVENTDLVVWYTFGAHHIVRPEDWSVMPVVKIGFMLKPVGFFDRNPGLDVPPPMSHAMGSNGTNGAACH